jgi:hypothetical protein
MTSYGAHSSDVSLRLQVDETEFRLSHVGSSYVIIKGPLVKHPPGNATITITVDGHSRTRLVFLPHGIQPGNPEVIYF